MGSTTNFKTKARALVLVLMSLFAISLPSFVSADFCSDASSKTNGFLSCGTTTVSFTDFKGQLSTPDASQYAPGLSQNQDLRQYIKNVVNFALGFLGLLAVIVVIYGGFLYVTAAGNDDQTGKGKKAVMYAVIGILIILSSFALVNTILQAGGGTDQGATNGSAPTSTTAAQIAQRQALFAYAGSQVQTIAHDFVSAYQNYTETNADLVTLLDTTAESNITAPQDLTPILQNKKNILTNLVNKAGALSQVAEKATEALTLSPFDSAETNYIGNNTANIATDTTGGKLQAWINGWLSDYASLQKNLLASIGGPNTEDGIQGANNTDFAQAVTKAETQLQNLGAQLGINIPSTPAPGTPFTTPAGGIATTLADLEQFVPASAGAKLAIANVNNANVLQFVNDMSLLYNFVKDMQFVYTVITVDKNQGNAPLPVNFDGLKSLDPNNHTIPDGNYHWLFGDEPVGSDCTKSTKTGVTPPAHMYLSSGTYIAELCIVTDSASGYPANTNEQRPSDGVAYQTITVKPAVAHIELTATPVGSPAIKLSDYDSIGEQVVNMQNLPVVLSEAKNGITFNLAGTMIGSKADTALTSSAIAKIQWDFGDKTNPKNIIQGLGSDAKANNPTITYSKEGTYLVNLEITDENGVTDRKIFNIIVGSLASRVQAAPGQVGQLGDQIQFDSISTSDVGPITSYNWTLTDKTGKAAPGFTPPPTSVDSFKYTFNSPGEYNVNLGIQNGATTASLPEPLSVTIKSKPPVAQFTALNTDPTHPNKFTLNGTGSYDPDMTPTQIMTYKWEVNGAPGNCTYYKQASGSKGFDESSPRDCTDLGKEGTNGYSSTNGFLELKFNTKGKYTVTLDVQDDSSNPGNSIPQEQDVTIDNVLDVGWSDGGTPLTAQLNNGSAAVQFKVFSENGVAYQIETGDNQKETGTITKGAPKPTSTGGTAATVPTHVYTQAGVYKVKLTVYDSQDNGNATYRKVLIGSENQPVAAISLNEDGQDIGDTTQPVQGNRTSVFTFDASKSLNIDGSGRNLNYSWDFGDGSNPSPKKIATHTYTDIGDSKSKDFTAKLTVTDADDATVKPSQDNVVITIQLVPPVITGLSAVPVGNNFTTPVSVKAAVIGANDPDGQIVSYKWWYYDTKAPDTQLGVQITQSPTATILVGTNGVEGQKKTYKFGVIATDNDNLKFDSSTDLNDALIPSIDVVNGPNKAPVAKFSVDHTTINLGDSVNFSSSSFDPDKDGTIVSYMWNFDGTAYTDPGDKTYDQANISYTYTKAAKDGFKVRLKVRDNNGAESISDPVTIFVDSKASPPIAAFTSKQLDGKKIQFTNNSTVDTANGATLKSYAWDFDVATDSNGDGIKDNDIQATDATPTFEYPDYGIYRAKLTVTDDQGGTNSVSNFVNVKAPVVVQTQQTAPATSTTPSALAAPLQARLLSDPATSVADGKIHLQGDSANVTFDFSTSTGNIKSFVIDKNIFYDSDGDGIKDNDADYQSSQPGKWTSEFFRSYGADTVRLTVTDATGKKSTVDKAIIFDPIPVTPQKTATNGSGQPTALKNSNGTDNNQLSASLLAGYEVVNWQLLLVSVVGFGIFIASTLNKKKNARNKSK